MKSDAFLKLFREEVGMFYESNMSENTGILCWVWN